MSRDRTPTTAAGQAYLFDVAANEDLYPGLTERTRRAVLDIEAEVRAEPRAIPKPLPNPTDLPDRIVVGANGAYWRDYGSHYSMPPVSEDNDPVEVVAAYVRAEPRAEGLDVAPHPGENHEFRTTCLRCGERGMLHVSLITPKETVTIGEYAALAAEPETGS